jgi:hypothetical protein
MVTCQCPATPWNSPPGRTLGIVVAPISAIVTFFSIEAHPLGGVVLIDVDVLITYGPTVHGDAFVPGGIDDVPSPARDVGATVRLIGVAGRAPFGTAGWPTEVAPCWGLRRSDLQVHSAPWTSELRARPMDGGATRARAAVFFA